MRASSLKGIECNFIPGGSHFELLYAPIIPYLQRKPTMLDQKNVWNTHMLVRMLFLNQIDEVPIEFM